MKRKTEDQELLLELLAQCLGDGAISEGIEEDSLERAKSCAWGTLSSNARRCRKPGPPGCWFSELGRTVSSLHTPKMETVRKALGYIRVEGLPSAGEPPPAAWPWRSPRSPSPFLTARARPQPGFPSQQLGLHPETPGQASKLGVVAEGPRQQSTPANPWQGQWDPRGAGCLCRHMLATQPLIMLAFLLIWLGGSQSLLLDLGALGLGLNRASFNDSNQDGLSPFPIPLDFIFSHTQLYYRMLASQSLKGP